MKRNLTSTEIQKTIRLGEIVKMSSTSKYPESGTWSILVSPNTNYYLPPEIWAKIFHYLSAQDVVSVTEACPEWKELLESERKYALLEQVLPLLNLPLRTNLKCREVSKGAKKAVDNLLEIFATKKHNYLFEHEESESRRHFNMVTDVIDFHYYDFSDSFMRPKRTVQNFLNHMGENRDPGKNPFVTRSLSVPLYFENDDDFTPVERMLTQFGHHIWALTILVEILILDDAVEWEEDGEEPFTVTASSKRLPNLLSLVPNLKMLDVSGCDTISLRLVLVGDISPGQLPELPNLVTLSFGNWFKEASLPFTILRRYGPQITTLIDTNLHSLLQLYDLTVTALNELLPNLKKLEVKVARGAALTKLANVNWKLDDLTIGFLCGRSLKEDLFNIINNFRQTLVQLQINDKVNHRLSEVSELVKDNVSVELIPLPIEALPHLKILCLNICFTQLDEYDFFWKFARNIMSNLEEIHFHPWHWYVDEEGTIDNMLANEIFQKMPNIRKILHWWKRNAGRLQLHVFTRN